MKIDDKLLTKLEVLSSLKIENEKRAAVLEDLGKIVNFVKNLDDLDLTSLQATYTTAQGDTPLREDIPFIDENIINNIFKCSPKNDNEFFIVPKILE